MEDEFTFVDGSMGRFELSVYPVTKGVVFLPVDVAARKRANAVLESDSKYRESLQNARVGKYRAVMDDLAPEGA